MTAAPSPLVLDERALHELGGAGYRWQEGHADLVRYRWLLPPDWVLAGTLPSKPPGGIEPLCGAGDRSGRLTAVLGFLRGIAQPPHALASRGAAPGAVITAFTSGSGPVAERIERRDEKRVVTTIHAFLAAGEPYRFFIAAVGPAGDPALEKQLRTIASALWLADNLDLDRLRAGRLHG